MKPTRADVRARRVRIPGPPPGALFSLKKSRKNSSRGFPGTATSLSGAPLATGAGRSPGFCPKCLTDNIRQTSRQLRKRLSRKRYFRRFVGPWFGDGRAQKDNATAFVTAPAFTARGAEQCHQSSPYTVSRLRNPFACGGRSRAGAFWGLDRMAAELGIGIATFVGRPSGSAAPRADGGNASLRSKNTGDGRWPEEHAGGRSSNPPRRMRSPNPHLMQYCLEGLAAT